MAYIYRISNLASGGFYIGSTIDPKSRWKTHRSELNRGVHKNCHLQRAWHKYGEISFSFEILEECISDQVTHAEQKYLDEVVGMKQCYNILPYAYAPGRGRKWTAEEREIASRNQAGLIFSRERCSNISLAKRGKKHSMATRQKIQTSVRTADCRKNKFSDEQKDEMKRLFATDCFTQTAIAKMFGCSKSHVRRILFDIQRSNRA